MGREQSGAVSHSDRRKDTLRYNRWGKEDGAGRGRFISVLEERWLSGKVIVRSGGLI